MLPRPQGPQAVRWNRSVRFRPCGPLADAAMVEAARLMVYSRRRPRRSAVDLGFVLEVLRLRRRIGGSPCRTTVRRRRHHRHPVERFYAHKITQIYEGTNQIQRVVMSRALLR